MLVRLIIPLLTCLYLKLLLRRYLTALGPKIHISDNGLAKVYKFFRFVFAERKLYSLFHLN